MASATPVPRTTKPRPALPKFGNKLLRHAEALPPVKFQPIKKDGNVVIVGRVKIPTPVTADQKSEHAYVLRRYDTGFISLSTMWKGAFPAALPTEEKEEIHWVKANFDVSLPAGTKEDMRLAGIWIPIDVAGFLAPSYNLLHVISILANASPDAETTAKAFAQPAAEPVNGSSSPHKSSTVPNKRPRKETSDTPNKAPAATSVNGAIALLSAPGSTSKTRPKSKSPAPPPSRSTPSRSTKARKAASPAPAPAPATTPATTARRSSRIPKPYTEGDGYSEGDYDHVKPPLPDPAEDIAESQNLVQRLMAQKKEAALTPSVAKRTLEEVEAPLTLNLDQPSQEVTYVPPSERALVTNRRILPRWPTMPQLDSNQKSAAWGTLAFAIGWGAVAAILPQFL